MARYVYRDDEKLSRGWEWQPDLKTPLQKQCSVGSMWPSMHMRTYAVLLSLTRKVCFSRYVLVLKHNSSSRVVPTVHSGKSGVVSAKVASSQLSERSLARGPSRNAIWQSPSKPKRPSENPTSKGYQVMRSKTWILLVSDGPAEGLSCLGPKARDETKTSQRRRLCERHQGLRVRGASQP